MTIERSSHLPLYYQLQRAIEEEIQSNNMLPGDMLPSESVIANKYHVSRSTVRLALRNLESMCVVERISLV